MKYKIDVVRIRENSIELNGWVIGKTPQSGRNSRFRTETGNRWNFVMWQPDGMM